MLIVFVAWFLYVFAVTQIIKLRLWIVDFPTTLLILIILFFVLFSWSAKRSIRPKRRSAPAQPQEPEDHPVSSSESVAPSHPPVPSASNSGSVSFRVAGVTFENDDGESRQDILRHLKFGDAPWADDPEDLTAELEETEYNGQPAIAVLVNGYQVGFVPKTKIPRVSAALRNVATCYVSSVRVIGGGTAQDGTSISYGCEITLEY